LPVVGTIHHPITMDKRIDIAHCQMAIDEISEMALVFVLNMQIKVARQLDP
jgi:hypothetical protein